MNNYKKAAVRISKYLSDLQVNDKNKSKFDFSKYDDKLNYKLILGGIFDPESKLVLGEHYSTSHFMIIKLLEFIKNESEGTYSEFQKAFKFTLTNIYKYKYATWGTHRDFNNFALAISLEISKSHSNKLYRDIKTKMKFLVPQSNRAGNWIYMKALTYSIMSKHYSNPFYWYFERLYKSKLNKYIDEDYCVHDIINESFPIQYHVYSMSILYLMYHITKDSSYLDKFIYSSEFLENHITYQGDFNYIGRGQRQIFGYGSYYFVMNALFNITKDSKYIEYLIKQSEFIESRNTKSSHLDLCLNKNEDNDRAGWYDYHNNTVYNAFFSSWVYYSDFGDNIEKFKDTEVRIACEDLRIYDYQTSKIAKNKNWMIQFGVGGTKYETDLGFSPNIISHRTNEFYSCPMGSTDRKYGKLNPYKKQVKYNTFSPIIHNHEFPALSRIISEKLPNGFLFSFIDNDIEIQREIVLDSSDLRINDEILKKNELKFTVINIPFYKYPISIHENVLYYEDFIIEINTNIPDYELKIEYLGVFGGGTVSRIFVKSNLRSLKVSYNFKEKRDKSEDILL